MNGLSNALFLALANQAIVKWLVAPLKQKFPAVDFWYLIYVAGVTGAVIGWYSEINLFPVDQMPSVLLGRVLTAVIVGGGSSLIHDIFNPE